MSPKTLLIGATGVSVAVGGTIGAGYLLQKRNKTASVEEKLKEENLTPLDTSIIESKHNDTWKKLIKNHQKSANSGKTISNLAFSINANNNPIESDITTMKNKCRDLLKEKETEEEFNTYLQNARDWCVEESNFAKD